MTPLPFTFLVMGAFLFECSAYQTAAVFLGMLSAHGVTTGLGMLHRLTHATSLGKWADSVPSIKERIIYSRQTESQPSGSYPPTASGTTGRIAELDSEMPVAPVNSTSSLSVVASSSDSEAPQNASATTAVYNPGPGQV